MEIWLPETWKVRCLHNVYKRETARLTLMTSHLAAQPILSFDTKQMPILSVTYVLLIILNYIKKHPTIKHLKVTCPGFEVGLTWYNTFNRRPISNFSCSSWQNIVSHFCIKWTMYYRLKQRRVIISFLGRACYFAVTMIPAEKNP